MMKTAYLKLISMAALVAAMYSCSDFLDVNVDPNNPSIVSASSRIAGAISTSSGAAQWRGVREIAGVMQYGLNGLTTGANRNAETWRFTASYFLWQNAYVNTMPNAVDLIVLGEDEGNLHFTGVGKTLLALNFGLLTDQYGPIVVDEYYDGRSQLALTPVFQDQQTVYQRIQTLLDEALVAFDSPQNSVGLNANGGDLLYQGDVDKWKRFAWALKARYLNHLSRKSSLYDPQAIITACANAFNADGMDAEFAYLSGALAEDQNPWYSWGGFTGARGVHRYTTWSQFFVNMLTTLPVTNAAYEDPRIGLIMTAAEDGEYRGLNPGAGLVGGQGTLADGSPGDATKTALEDYPLFGNGGFYTRETSPAPFITYAEVKFIEAEARLRNADAAGALAAYEEGIRADMRKLGVPAAAINAFWQAQLDNGVVSHFSNLVSGLSHIFRQKYIALCLNPETWVDLRKNDYSSNIYGPSLTRPRDLNDAVFDLNNPNQWIQAMVYETNEQNRNPDAVGDNSEQTRLLTPLWWNVPE